jgi:pimeloyl-ACP methyl ester carboxylesterase
MIKLKRHRLSLLLVNKNNLFVSSLSRFIDLVAPIAEHRERIHKVEKKWLPLSTTIEREKNVLRSQIIRSSTNSETNEKKTKHVFVLHGLMGQGKNWRGPIQSLAEKIRHQQIPKSSYEFHLIDLRGHGNSPNDFGQEEHREHTIENAAKDLVRYQEHHNVIPDAVIGHSLGGKIALEYSALKRDAGDDGKKKKLVVFTLDSVPYAIEKDMFGAEFILRAIENLPDIIPNRDYLREQLEPMKISSAIIEWLGSNLVLTKDSKLQWQFDRKVLRALYESFQKRNLWHALEDKDHDNVFVNIIKAEKSSDWNVDAMKRIETLKEEKKVNYHVLKNAGHWVHTDNPIGLVQIIHDELASADNAVPPSTTPST